MRIVVVIEGGCVREVHAPKGCDVEVIVADVDEYKAAGLNNKQVDSAVHAATRGLMPIENWRLDKPSPKRPRAAR